MGLETLIGVAVAGASAFSTVKGLFGGGQKQSAPAPPPMPAAPTPDDAAAKAADAARRKRINQTQTVYTDPLGTASQADVSKKALLGQ